MTSMTQDSEVTEDEGWKGGYDRVSWIGRYKEAMMVRIMVDMLPPSPDLRKPITEKTERAA